MYLNNVGTILWSIFQTVSGALNIEIITAVYTIVIFKQWKPILYYNTLFYYPKI